VAEYFTEYLESNLEILQCISIARGNIEVNTTAMISTKIYPFIMISGGRLVEVEWDQIYRYSLTYSSNLLKNLYCIRGSPLDGLPVILLKLCYLCYIMRNTDPKIY